MRSPVPICIFATVLTAIACVGTTTDAEAGNEWGWAKPLNEKPGSLLYTSNRKHRRKTRSQPTTSHGFYRLRTYAQPKLAAPAHYPHVTVQSPVVMIGSTPTAQIPSQPVLGRQVIPTPTPVLQSPTSAPSVLDGWLVP